MTDTDLEALTLDEAVEIEIRDALLEHFSPLYQDRVYNYVDALLARDGFINRFEYLRSVVGFSVFNPKSNILISGCGSGSEMITARQFGFGSIHGVEVEDFWISICQSRLRYLPDMHVAYYDGKSLPYQDGEFDVVASGHVIEHTESPEYYLRECMRVLSPGGYISLEFPNRYHHTELHTHLPSFEWLPRPMRNSALRILSGNLSPLREHVKKRYRDIIVTDLKQISVGRVNRLLKRINCPYSIINSVRAMPGVTRCVIQKDIK